MLEMKNQNQECKTSYPFYRRSTYKKRKVQRKNSKLNGEVLIKGNRKVEPNTERQKGKLI